MNHQLDNKNQFKESEKLIKYNLETERLRLLPLEPKQLKLSINVEIDLLKVFRTFYHPTRYMQ